jgi:hypothetical protein
MASLPFALSASKPSILGEVEKKCGNVFAEKDPSDPGNPWKLVETPGSLRINDFAGPIRGLSPVDVFAPGLIHIGQGNTLSSYNLSSGVIGSYLGTLSGTDDLDWAFTETQGMVLANGIPYIGFGLAIRRVTDGLTSDPDLEIGSTPANVATAAFSYSIDGVIYNKTAVTAGTAPGNDVVPLGLYGAVALDIGADGTIDVIEAPANATGYATAVLAAAALPAEAYDHVRIGYLTASKSDGAFTFGSTALDAANTTVAYVDGTVNTGWTDLLADAGETGFTSVASVGQRFILTYGPRFCYTEVLNGAATNVLYYYTAEDAPDDLVAVRIWGSYLVFFGTKTIEFWTRTSSATDPFSQSTGTTQKVGCLRREAIIDADNGLFFVDDTYKVRRLGAGGSQALSKDEAWVEREIQASTLTTIRGDTYSESGHTFLRWRTDRITVVHDLATGLFHTRASLNAGTERWTHLVQTGGRVFKGDADGVFVEQKAEYTSDDKATAGALGTLIVREMTAFAKLRQFQAVPAVMLVCTKGVGDITGDYTNPLAEMRLSFDNGQTFTSWRQRSIGAQGKYSEAAIWRRNGSSKRQGVVFDIRKSDPVRASYKALETVEA